MCVLRVTGPQFDVEDYLRESRMKPCKIFRLGTPRLPLSRPNGPIHTTSGFNVEVSGADWSDLAQQIRDAHSFLTRHEDELRILTRFPTVDDVRLDFPTNLRIGENNVAIQSEYFPSGFLKLVGTLGVGLEVSIYPYSDASST